MELFRCSFFLEETAAGGLRISHGRVPTLNKVDLFEKKLDHSPTIVSTQFELPEFFGFPTIGF
jgi:hypothetical protein